MLSSAEITRLLSTSSKSRQTSRKNRWFDGFEWRSGKPPANVRFEGKAGSIRRSRKGATRRLANGRRYVVGQYLDNPEVKAYKVTP